MLLIDTSSSTASAPQGLFFFQQDVICILSLYFTRERLHPGAVLYDIGDSARLLYVIEEGSVEIITGSLFPSLKRRSTSFISSGLIPSASHTLLPITHVLPAVTAPVTGGVGDVAVERVAKLSNGAIVGEAG